LRRGLDRLRPLVEFALPTHATGWSDAGFAWDDTGCRTDCSWFGFMLLVTPAAPFTRTELAKQLDAAKIGNRMLFGGNLVRQPAFVELARRRPEAMRIVGPLNGADRMMREAIFIGVYPGLTVPMLDYVVERVLAFTGKS
jgi:CDP-6-deoxy-D-xylo-4-hexulose-3-dehydrase